MSLVNFADSTPIISVPDSRALGAGIWEDEAIEALSSAGAVIMRGPIVREDAVEVALSVLDDELLDDAFWSTPRSKVEGKTLTATEYPSPRTIQLHSEMAYMPVWPRFVGFHALEVASEGGQTTVCNIDAVSADLGDRLEAFAEKGVTYRRTFQKGIDIPWQHAFQTTERADVEAVGERLGMKMEWLSDDALVTTHTAQGTISAEDGRPIFFNQAHLFHASTIDAEVREGLERLYGAGRLPRQATYGDGTGIPEDDLEAVRQAFERNQTAMFWQPGDIMILDNMRFAHGRLPFKGSRRLHVAMARAESQPTRTAVA